MVVIETKDANGKAHVVSPSYPVPVRRYGADGEAAEPVVEALLASAARTEAVNSAVVTPPDWARGFQVVLDVTAVPAAGQNLDVYVYEKSRISGNLVTYVGVLPQVTSAGGAAVRRVTVYPGIADALVTTVDKGYNGFACSPIYLYPIHSGAGSWTYRADVIWLP